MRDATVVLKAKKRCILGQMIVHVSEIAKRRRMKIATNNSTMFSLFYLLTFCKRRARSEQVSVNTYMYACILHMRQNFWQFLQMGVAIQGDDAENIWKKRQISRKNGGKTSNDTETWKMPYLKIVAELPSVMAKVMFSMVWFLKKKEKNWGELW